MAITVAASGTVTTDGSEQQLGTIGVPGSYLVDVSRANQANGDTIWIIVYKKVLSTSPTDEIVYEQDFTDAPPLSGSGNGKRQSVEISVPVTVFLTTSDAVRVAIYQTAGSPFDADWSIGKIA